MSRGHRVARRIPSRAGAAALAGALALVAAGCDTARVLAPPPPLRVASASHFAVDVEFGEPLDRASAEEVSRYTLRDAATGTSQAITQATLVDTLYGRVVQLLIPDWLGSDPDTTDFDLTTAGVLTVDGRSTGTRDLRFRTGLSYRTPLRELFDQHCSACHGAMQAGGSYRTDSYAALFGNGTDGTPNLIANDPTCLTVRRSKPRNSMFVLGNLSYLDFEILRNWVTSYAARL